MDLTRDCTLAASLSRIAAGGVEVASIINIGAGSGADTPAVQRFWPGSRTLLIDMDTRFLHQWRELKRDLPDLRWAVCGAASEDRTGFMRKSDVSGGIAIRERQQDALPVEHRRIDTLVAEHKLEAPYFLRFDTHGAELDILAGARETLKQAHLVQMECYNFKLDFARGENLTFDEMIPYMRTLGFRVIDLCGPLFRKDGALWQMHLFFVREDHPAFRSNSYSVKTAPVVAATAPPIHERH